MGIDMFRFGPRPTAEQLLPAQLLPAQVATAQVATAEVLPAVANTTGAQTSGLPSTMVKLEEHTAAVMQKMATLRRNYGDRKIVVSVDQLDYTRGIPHKLLAMKEMFDKYPKWLDKVVYVQIAVPQLRKQGLNELQASEALPSACHEWTRCRRECTS